MPSMSKSDDHSQPSLFMESVLVNLERMINQRIAQIASYCQIKMQASLEQIWTAAEQDRASLAQRMVSDYLLVESTNGLPNYHPLHWFQSQLEFRRRGVLDFSDYETAQASTQAILNQLQAEIATVIATQQMEIAEEFDRQIQDIRQSLATVMQPQLSDQRIIVKEYINSYLPLARLQLREVDKFGFFLDGKRVSPSTIVISTTQTVRPWYLLGFQEKQQPCYRVSLQQLQPLITASLARSFQDMHTQIKSYIDTELQQQLHRLVASTPG
jgi:hypothetical protein